jgi:hypothetical protein
MADPLTAAIPIKPTGAAMRIAVESRRNPLNAENIPPCNDFIDRVAARPGRAAAATSSSTTPRARGWSA